MLHPYSVSWDAILKKPYRYQPMLLQMSQLSNQAADAAATTTSAAAAPETSLSLLELLLKGGPLMIPIVLLSILSLSIIIERWLYIRKASASHPQLLPQIKDLIMKGDLKAAAGICAGKTGVVAEILAKGISKVGKPVESIEKSMEKTASIALLRVEKRMGVLGIVAGIAPMLGFIGTISGVIKIFYNISVTDNISIGIIAGGLYEKMITSGAGLIVGVIAYAGYHYLNLLIDRLVLQIESESNEFLDFLQQ